ncbi:macrophage mannose receptor 1-like isoform X1 [Seriola dumerili]|uniref:macrophage mannose receptor 1-like isoform X1 n=1 Tax=Seriola dumerili TaxID=41447 RepID=UPI000BBE1913|nr:macrophage mannose receptor 1-like isoform X1 [Seriola dumerili]
MLTIKITCTTLVLLIQTLQCLASDDSSFQLTNRATGFCLVKSHHFCHEIRWTTGDRLMVQWLSKCLGVQGKSVGSEISLYECDENSELQKWECKNETVLALKGQELYIELTADNTAVLSKTIGPNNHLTISGTSSGACTRTYRELFTIGGNANGRTCMFPFMYKTKWYSDCTTVDVAEKHLWCSVETKFEHNIWGFCPTNSKQHWNQNIATGVYYQLNTQSALTWSQAVASCKQQGASLLSITDPHEKVYVTALLGAGGRGKGDKLWTGLTLDPEHGWQWSNGKPYRYVNWDSGHPLPNPGQNCAIIDGAVQYSWQSSSCTRKLGYICNSDGTLAPPTEAVETGFCSSPWIPYNGHCFHLNRTQKTWSEAQKACRKEGGDLVSICNVEDQSFVISQLGYASTDELWIGLNDRKTEGLFDWTDHSTVTFTSWEFGKPSVFTDQEDCALIRGENGNWADRVCGEKHGFICMKTSATEPSGDEVEQNAGCKIGWKRHGSYCYFVGTETKTFDEAKDGCKSSDSYLADVSTGVDNAFLVSLVGLRPEKYFWLGLSNQKNIDQFVWTNTDSVRFTHWNAEMPGYQQGCVAMTTGFFAGLWDVLPCDNKEKYICKHLAEGAVLTLAPPTVPTTKCADGWNQVASRKYCYKFFAETPLNKRTWYEARDYCMAIGGDLLSIHSTDDLKMPIKSYRTFWIGLSAPDPITGYVWSDGSPVNFQHWEDGEPNNKNNVESCAEFNPYNQQRTGSWNDVQCEKYNGWICQIHAGKTPNPPPDPITPDNNKTSDGWLEWNGIQYYINEKWMAMEDARNFCQQRHGDLVTINSEAENVFLWKQISRSYGSYWIGLTVELDGTYEWIDGSQGEFERWDEGQPDFNTFDENCAVMVHETGFWHDYNCGFEHKSICKRSGSPPANTTVAPTVPPKGGCLLPWKKINSKCYIIIKNQKLTWDGARKQCLTMNGNLASIPSRDVQAFLVTQMADTPTTDLWIGFHSFHGHQFYWADGRPKSYVNLALNRLVYDDIFHRPHRILDLNHLGDFDTHFYHEIHHFQRFETLFSQQRNKCAVINTNPLLGIGKWIPQSCNDTNGFVCLQKADPSLPDSPEPTVTTDYAKIMNDSIKAVTQPMTWDEAKKHCEDDDANLASLRNEWSQVYVEWLALSLNTSLWIGMNKMQTSGYFRYIDGWRMKFTSWGHNEPSPDRPCVFVDIDGKWKTANCNQTMNSVCMKSTDVPPTESSLFPGVCPDDPDSLKIGENYFWLPFKGYCYIFFTDEKEWASAAASCARHGGSLASIEDPSEQEFIQNNTKTYKDSHTSFWIGLYKTHKGDWLWLDNTVKDYTNWDEGQPTSQNHGAISTSDGTWRAGAQWYDRPYICKTPKVFLPVPSPAARVGINPNHRGHIILAVVLVIAGIAVGGVIAFFLYKKSIPRLTIPGTLNTFDNPLFFSNEQSPPETVDSGMKAEDVNHEPVITV